MRTVVSVSNGCRDLRRRVKRRSITKRTPIAACTVLGQLCTRATVPPRHSRRGLWCERGGTVPDPFSTVAEHPGPRKGLGKRLDDPARTSGPSPVDQVVIGCVKSSFAIKIHLSGV